MGCGSSKSSAIIEPEYKVEQEGEDMEEGEYQEERNEQILDEIEYKNSKEKSIKKYAEPDYSLLNPKAGFVPIKSDILGKYSSSKRIIYYRNSLKHHLNTSETSGRTSKIDNSRYNTLLYVFDFKKKLFHYCNIIDSDCSDWLSKKLPYEDEDKDLPFYKRNYHLSQSDLFSYCQISKKSIAIVGGYNPLYSFIEYNIKKNKFIKRSFEIALRTRPNLVAFDGVLCSISGNKGDDYCCDFDIYDLKGERWVEMTPIPTPHYQGCCYTFKRKTPCTTFKQIRHDLYVAGGLTSINKVNNYNGVIDKFDFEKLTWTSLRMEDIFNVFKVPRLINTYCAKITKKSEVIFLNEKRTGQCYLNSKNKTLNKLKKFGEKEENGKKGFPMHAIYSRGKVYSVSHDHSEEEDRRLKIHCVDTLTGDWSLELVYLAKI